MEPSVLSSSLRPHFHSSLGSFGAKWVVMLKFICHADKKKTTRKSPAVARPPRVRERKHISICEGGENARIQKHTHNTDSHNPAKAWNRRQRWRAVATSKWEVSKWSTAIISANSSPAAAPPGQKRPERVGEATRPEPRRISNDSVFRRRKKRPFFIAAKHCSDAPKGVRVCGGSERVLVAGLF